LTLGSWPIGTHPIAGGISRAVTDTGIYWIVSLGARQTIWPIGERERTHVIEDRGRTFNIGARP
jgi:hypothetical protein